MKFKGTEKWVLGRIDKSYQYINGEGWGDFARVVVKMKGASYTSSIGESNAKLIAAAPELLEALKMFVDYCYGTELQESERFKKGKEAIEKALK